MLEIENLSVSAKNGQTILREVSLSLAPGENLFACSRAERRAFCGRTIGFIPQNPMTAFFFSTRDHRPADAGNGHAAPFLRQTPGAGYLRRRSAARPSLRHSARARRAAERTFRRHAAARRDGARSRCPAVLSASGRTDERTPPFSSSATTPSACAASAPRSW